MIVGVIIDLLVGGLCVALGLLIWRKQKISLLHSYHYQHVKQEDLPAYTRQVGIGMIVMGAGIGVTGLMSLADSPYWWIPLSAGIVLGWMILWKAQKKYNGSVMG